MHGHLEEAFLWPHGPYRIKLTFIFLKSAVRHYQGSVGAPHSLENGRASGAQLVNVRRKVVDRILICEHVRKPLYGPRPLIFDLTASTVKANSLRHPQGDGAIATVFGHKQAANKRRTDVLCDQGLRYLWGHRDLCTVILCEKRTILMKSCNSIWDRS